MVEEIDHHERPPRRSYLAPPKTPYGFVRISDGRFFVKETSIQVDCNKKHNLLGKA